MLSDEISRRCTTECPKSKGVIDLGEPEGKLACYIGYTSDETKNKIPEVKGYNHTRKKYCKNAKTFTNHFCRKDMPFGLTADVSWNTGTITCNKTCTHKEGIVSKYKKIKISEEEHFTFSICYTSFRCPNEEAQVLYAANRSDGKLPRYQNDDDDCDGDNNDDCDKDDCDDDNNKKNDEIYCIGRCNTKTGFIAEVSMGPSVTFSCIFDHKCPLTAPYVYEFIRTKIGEVRYEHKGSYFGGRFATSQGPMMQTLDYYEEFEEEYAQGFEEDYKRFQIPVYINAIDGSNKLATKCAKACTRLDGILYATSDLSSANDISHDYKKLGPWRNYNRGFCYSSTKRCLNSNDYRRIRSDGLHSTITCVKRCNHNDGYILKIEELIKAYLEVEEIRPELIKILNQPGRGTNKQINRGTIEAEFFPNDPSDICLYGNLVT